MLKICGSCTKRVICYFSLSYAYRRRLFKLHMVRLLEDGLVSSLIKSAPIKTVRCSQARITSVVLPTHYARTQPLRGFNIMTRVDVAVVTAKR